MMRKNGVITDRKQDIELFVQFGNMTYLQIIKEDMNKSLMQLSISSLMYLISLHHSIIRYFQGLMYKSYEDGSIISVNSKKKIQKMNELYTFNSQQFQAVENRPASTDNTPNLRKRLISTKYSPKPSGISRASTREEVHSSNDNRFRITKRVKFLEDNQFSRDEAANQGCQSSLKKTRSMAHKNIRENLFKEQCSADLDQRYQCKPTNRNQGYYLPERSMSTEENAVKQIMTKKHAEMISSKARTGRQRRILSLKLSPKIVPISDRKLPKAFKIDYCDQYSLPKIQRKDKGILQKIDMASHFDTHKSQMTSSSKKADGISRLARLLLMQAKIFEKLS